MTNPAVSRTCDFCSDFSSIDKTTNKESIKNLPLEDRPRESFSAWGGGADGCGAAGNIAAHRHCSKISVGDC